MPHTLGWVVALTAALAGCGGSVATTTGDLARFCELARAFEEDEPLETVVLDDSGAPGEGLEAAQERVMAYFSRPGFRERVDEFEAVAPDDIAPVVEFVAVGSRMAAVGDFSRVQSAEAAQAQRQLADYLEQHCGAPTG